MESLLLRKNHTKPSNEDNEGMNNNNFGFKSRKCPPQNEDLNDFEADVYNMIKNIEFRNVRDDFQDQLQEDIKKINISTKPFTPPPRLQTATRSTKLRTTNYSLIT